MTAITDFYCDYCNPGKERRSPPEGEDEAQGYAQVMARQFPMGWWEVPGKGPNDGPGHACPICVVNPDHFEDMLERREAAMHMVVDLHPPTDDATPFEGVDEAEDRTGETAPTDPSDDRSGPAVPSAER